MKTKIVIIIVIIIFALLSLIISSAINSPQDNISCSEEAKICPDGSTVVRSGSKCEFAECPKIPTQVTVIASTTPDTSIVIPNISNTTKLNKNVVISGISITPTQLISDSRCPVDVQCIWAGTVEIRVRIENGNNIKEATLQLGGATNFLNTGIVFKSALPQPYSRVSIKPENYYFEFAVVPAQSIKINESQKPIF